MLERCLELKLLLFIFRRRMLAIFICAAVCGCVSFFVSGFLLAPQYTAEASLYVLSNMNRSENGITSSELTASQQLVNTYIVVLKSDKVLDQVISRLNLNLSPNDIRDHLRAVSIDGTEAFKISFGSDSPELSQSIVNMILEVAPLEIIRVVKAGSAEVIDRATLPTQPSSPNTALYTAAGALFGFVIAFGISIACALLSTKIHDEEYLTQTFMIPVLGSIPMLAEHRG